MEIKTIGILRSMPVTWRDYQRFGVDILKGYGIRVWLVDLSAMFDSRYLHNESQEDFSPKELRRFSSIQEWEDFLQEIKDEHPFIIDAIDQPLETLNVLELLKRYNIPYAAVWSNAIPAAQQKNHYSIMSRIFWSRVALRFKKILLANRLKAVIKPPFILAGGANSIDERRVTSSTQIIWGHTLDYDLYLKYQQNPTPALSDKKYAVFLDEAVPYHPDFLISHMPPCPYSDPKDYYTEMNRMFDFLEEKLKMPIVIAAHPKAPYQSMLNNVYETRRIMNGETINLVAHAEYVLAHSSTAINYVVLFKKPILLLKPDRYDGTFLGNSVDIFARELKSVALNFDLLKKLDLATLFKYDQGAYQQYKEKYIKKAGSLEKNFWGLVIENLCEKYSQSATHLV
jgi:hypothetical protein